MTKEEAANAFRLHRLRVLTLARIVEQVGMLARKVSAVNPDAPGLENVPRILDTLRRVTEQQAELAKLYHAFTLDVPENTLTDRLR